MYLKKGKTLKSLDINDIRVRVSGTMGEYDS